MGRFVTRFEVAENSMAPTLLPGDYLLAVRLPPRPGDVVVFEHPHRRGFWLVKRVHRLDGGRMFVISDSDQVTAVDSRKFGPVMASKTFRVVWRYWPVPRVGRLRHRLRQEGA